MPGLHGRLSWRPPGLRAANSALSSVGSLVSSALRNAAGLSSWHSRFNFRARPWLGWLPLSLSYAVEREGLDRFANAYHSLVAGESARLDSPPGLLAAVTRALRPETPVPAGEGALAGTELLPSLDFTRDEVRPKINDALAFPRQGVNVASLAEIRVITDAGRASQAFSPEREVGKVESGVAVTNSGWFSESPSEVSGSFRGATWNPTTRFFPGSSSSPEVPLPEARPSSGGSIAFEEAPVSALQSQEHALPPDSAERAILQERTTLIERLVEQQTAKLLPVPGLELRWVGPAKDKAEALSHKREGEEDQQRNPAQEPKERLPAPVVVQQQPQQLDINAIADRVYESILRREVLEKERKGLY